MTSRTIILISLLVAVAIVGNTFIFLYREQTNQLIEMYIAKITTCGNITDEYICYDKAFCKGIYGPSCVGCKDSVFLECKKISNLDKIMIANEKSLCAQTQGRWQASIKGDYCSCQPGWAFDKAKGCLVR